MLETLNLLVGLAVVMLLVSFAVTLITQLVVAAFNLRGFALRLKVTNLLVLIDNGIHPKEAGQIAGLVLRDALVGRPGLPWPVFRYDPRRDGLPGVRRFDRPGFRWISGRRPTEVVHRDELTKLLLAFGRTPREYPLRWYWLCRGLNTLKLQRVMARSLKRNGIANPSEVLQKIRLHALDLEKSDPQLSNSERNNIAILRFAKSDFLGKLNGWFDQTVDRAGDLFTGWSQIAAFFVAFLVATTLQLDTFNLINQLSRDQGTHGQLVQWAIQNLDAPTPLQAKGPKPAAGHARMRPSVFAAAQKALESGDLITLPDSVESWQARWSQAVPCSTPGASEGCTLPRVSPLGVGLSTLLLSLGGPFWYAMLQNVLKLRSALASKDDTQRKDRQTNTGADADS